MKRRDDEDEGNYHGSICAETDSIKCRIKDELEVKALQKGLRSAAGGVRTVGLLFLIYALVFGSPAATAADARSIGESIHLTPAQMSARASLLLQLTHFLASKVNDSYSDNGNSSGHRMSSRWNFDNEAELLIDTDVSPDPVVAGSDITYTITVTNAGSTAAAAFTVTDDLPPETAFMSCGATGGGVCGGSGNNRVIAFASLAAEASVTITLVATVNCSLADGKEIGNTAAVHPSTPDPEADEDENDTVFTLVSNPLPVITGAAANPSVLWPPNHRMVNVRVDYSVTDSCGPVTIRLSISSNEPVNGTGDGDTAPDWEVVGEHQVRLRAERSGKGNGRTYTITITAIDSTNQSSSKAVTVNVPKSQGK